MALVICTWLWDDKYGSDYVEKLAAGVRRNVSGPYKFCLETDRHFPHLSAAHEAAPLYQRWISDPDLLKVKGCFARLRMFDPEWQRGLLNEGDRLVCLDLDLVITGPLDPLFDRPEPFVILKGANASNPNPMNGSCMMLRAGAHPEVWSEFSLEAASKSQHHDFPDDQGWIWNQIPHAAGWECGPESGIWSFAKGKGAAAWPEDNRLPDGARIVAFPGHRDPSQFTHLDWIRENWR